MSSKFSSSLGSQQGEFRLKTQHFVSLDDDETLYLIVIYPAISFGIIGDSLAADRDFNEVFIILYISLSLLLK